MKMKMQMKMMMMKMMMALPSVSIPKPRPLPHPKTTQNGPDLFDVHFSPLTESHFSQYDYGSDSTPLQLTAY